jgi:uncharacterized phage-associated protein
MPARYKALDIAKWFVNATDREAGDAITHQKLHKLLYYAQGWALALRGEPLFDEDFEAWANGPVVRTVWDHFGDVGAEALPTQRVTRRVASEDAALLSSVLEEYGIYSAKKLRDMTNDEPPWREARNGGHGVAAIPKALVKRHFDRLAAR